MKHERVLIGGKVPACFTTQMKVGHSDLTRSNAVIASWLVHFELDKIVYRLWVQATLEAKDPATPRLAGAAEAIARSLRIVAETACTPGTERRVDLADKTFALIDDQSPVFLKVAKDNDDGVAAAQGMAKFWKAGTEAMELITQVLPPTARGSANAVGFVVDYLEKGGDILDRLATSPLTQRATEVRADIVVGTTEVTVVCETYEVCNGGMWVRAKRSKVLLEREGLHKANKRAQAHMSSWAGVESKRNPGFVDLDRLEAWSEDFLDQQLAKLRANRTAHDAWVDACR